MTASVVKITNTPRAYAWGQAGGISAVLGWPETQALEAELWLGAHPLSPSRTLPAGEQPWPDLAAWEASTGGSVPFLMKLLAAGSPLSLQAHPDAAQAAAGYAQEESLGIALEDPRRTYKDPNAKPELVVAVHDGFSALCGFRPLAQTLAWIDELALVAATPEVARLRSLVADGDVRSAVVWLLSGDGQARSLVTTMTDAARREPERFALVRLLDECYPGDPGIAVAQLLNHVVLAAGEALWLPAGNIHAYLSGLAVEVMGPSDNVLRGGLTAKHIDVPALMQALDFTPGSPSRLLPEAVGAHAARYRPAGDAGSPGFEVLRVTGEARLETPGPATALVVEGAFALRAGGVTLTLARGEAAFLDAASTLHLEGAGTAFLATGS